MSIEHSDMDCLFLDILHFTWKRLEDFHVVYPCGLVFLKTLCPGPNRDREREPSRSNLIFYNITTKVIESYLYKILIKAVTKTSLPSSK